MEEHHHIVKREADQAFRLSIHYDNSVETGSVRKYKEEMFIIIIIIIIIIYIDSLKEQEQRLRYSTNELVLHSCIASSF